MAKLLLIEDNDAVRLSFKLTLELCGHEMIAIDHPDGFEAYLDDIDLVLTDYTLPGLSGEQVAEMTRAKSPGTPVIVITGNAENRDAFKANLIAKGAADVIIKPADTEFINSAIEACLAG